MRRVPYSRQLSDDDSGLIVGSCGPRNTLQVNAPTRSNRPATSANRECVGTSLSYWLTSSSTASSIFRLPENLNDVRIVLLGRIPTWECERLPKRNNRGETRLGNSERFIWSQRWKKLRRSKEKQQTSCTFTSGRARFLPQATLVGNWGTTVKRTNARKRRTVYW